MLNYEIAKIFYEIADFLEMEDVEFKPSAYRKVALALEVLEKDIADIYIDGGKKALDKEVPGVGESIAKKIEEYLKTGKIKYFEKLKKKTPIDMEKLNAIEGLGPKRIKALYQELNVENLRDLERVAKAGKIAPLFGFGSKTEKNILQGLKFLKKSKGRFLLGEILPKVKQIEQAFKNLKQVQEISVAGSIRRGKETIGDIDLLITTKEPAKVMDFFVSLPGVVKIWAKGRTKSSIRLKQGLDVDLRIVAQKSYGSALQYFTGSKEHNIATRKIAMNKGLKLNEYGLFKKRKRIAGSNEKELYKAIGLDWIPPELREDRGEIETALDGKLPQLIERKDIKGDLHCHSNWNGGYDTILEMAKKAMEMGYQYLGISDHTKFLRIENGLDEKQLIKQGEEIDGLNKRFKKQGINFQILKGVEVNILKNGLLDIKDETLSKLDYVIAGVHSNMKMSKIDMTKRIIRAMKNPYVKILSHPTGRILKRRDEYQIDFQKILKAAKEFKVALEINSFPLRLDLNDRNIRKAKEFGVKMAINSDAHQKKQLSLIEFGVIQARRGWAEKQDIINTLSKEKLLSFFK